MASIISEEKLQTAGQFICIISRTKCKWVMKNGYFSNVECKLLWEKRSEPLLTVPKAGFHSKKGASVYIVGFGECFLPCALSGE